MHTGIFDLDNASIRFIIVNWVKYYLFSFFIIKIISCNKINYFYIISNKSVRFFFFFSLLYSEMSFAINLLGDSFFLSRWSNLYCSLVANYLESWLSTWPTFFDCKFVLFYFIFLDTLYCVYICPFEYYTVLIFRLNSPLSSIFSLYFSLALAGPCKHVRVSGIGYQNKTREKSRSFTWCTATTHLPLLIM